MKSTRPYLIRAFYEWIVDSNCTPYIVVNAEFLGTEVPREYVEAGKIVLNISMTATSSLILSNDIISFQARFGGISRNITVPVNAVLAIYARENGRGMDFIDEELPDPPPATAIDIRSGGTKRGSNKDGPQNGGQSPHLTIVK